MKREFDVLVVGELNVDLILNNIEAFPAMGKEVIARDMTQTLGSSSAIFANNLCVLGSKVAFLGKVGLDNYADLVVSSLIKGGVDVSNIIKTPDFFTGVTVAMNFDNDRAMLTYPGAMNDLKIQDITDEILNSASHMHLSSIFLQEGLMPDVIRLFQRAKAAGMTTSFDPQWDPKEKWNIELADLLPHVDVFLPNVEELIQFTATSNINDALAKIKPYCNIVIVKNGVKGSTMWNGTELIEQKAYLNESVEDAIGAGDSFNSGFIHKFTNKKELSECLKFGSLTGAINTTGSGGTSAFKTLDNVKKVAKEKFNYTF